MARIRTKVVSSSRSGLSVLPSVDVIEDPQESGVRQAVLARAHWNYDISTHYEPVPLVPPPKFISERTDRRPVEHPFVFRVLQTPEELLEAARLRYLVYDIHVPYKNSQRIEFDEYDKCSIPMGGFALEPEGPRLVSFLRLVTHDVQPKYRDMIRDIVDACDVEELRPVIDATPLSPFPSSTEVLRQPKGYPSFAKALIRGFNASDDTCELSRTISHNDYRGMDLSRRIMEFGIVLCLERGYIHAIGSNDPRLTPMYRKYGYVTLPEVPRIDNRSVECISDVVFADFRHLPEQTAGSVGRIAAKHARDGYFCICPQTSCYTQGHMLDGTSDCPRSPTASRMGMYPILD